MVAIATVRGRPMGLSFVVFGSRMPVDRLPFCWIVSKLNLDGNMLITKLLTVANYVCLFIGVGSLTLIVSEWWRVLGSRFR